MQQMEELLPASVVMTMGILLSHTSVSELPQSQKGSRLSWAAETGLKIQAQ